MKSLVVALILCVCAPMSVCYAEDDKSETEQIPLIFEILYGEPATRSLPVLPKAYLCSREVNITFDEPLPYVDIRVLDAGSGAVVFASAYAYESEVCIDLSACDKGNYVIYLDAETVICEGDFSLRN